MPTQRPVVRIAPNNPVFDLPVLVGIEEKLFELGGMKTLISHNYYAEDEFWRTWNRPNYQRAKAVADPNNVFRDLYTKTCRAAQGQAEPR